MKLFGTDLQPILVVFKANGKQFEIGLKRDWIGNITILTLVEKEEGAIQRFTDNIEMVGVSPKNKIDKIKEILWLIYYNIRRG